MGIDTYWGGCGTWLENPGDLAAHWFDGAQCKPEFGDILVGGDEKVIHSGEYGGHCYDNDERQQTKREPPMTCGACRLIGVVRSVENSNRPGFGCWNRNGSGDRRRV